MRKDSLLHYCKARQKELSSVLLDLEDVARDRVWIVESNVLTRNADHSWKFVEAVLAHNQHSALKELEYFVIKGVFVLRLRKLNLSLNKFSQLSRLGLGHLTVLFWLSLSLLFFFFRLLLHLLEGCAAVCDLIPWICTLISFLVKMNRVSMNWSCWVKILHRLTVNDLGGNVSI